MAYELDSDLETLARRLAERTGESVSEAVRRALDERLARLDTPAVGDAASWAATEGLSAGPGYEIRLFGHPVIRRVDTAGRAREVAWRLRRSLLLVAYLALAPERRASKEELVEYLWPDAAADAVRRNFHPTVSDARRSLAGDSDLPTLAHRDGVYVLDPAVPWWIDVEAFGNRVRRAKTARAAGDGGGELENLQAAWSLVRASLLVDHDAEWIERPREALRRRWLEVLRRIGELAAELERPTLALDAWRRLLMEEPFEEQAHLEVMELYGHQGRRDLVRRQYVRLQELLAELEVEPAAKTQQRYLELMR